MSQFKISLSLIALASALLWTAACNDETTCGPGTILEAGECVPLQAANCAGEGVRFINGFCVPDFSDVCGDGTEPNEDGTACVAIESDTPDAGTPDMGGEDTGDEDTSGEDTGDAVTDQDDVGEGDADSGGDAEPDEEVAEEFDPECGDDLVANERICLWGVALNALTFEPLPHDAAPALEVQTKDRSATLAAFAIGQAVPSLAETTILEGGYFSMPAFDMDDDDADHQFLVMIGEEEDTEPTERESAGTNWMRTLAEDITPNEAETEYQKTLLLVPMAPVDAWNDTSEFDGAPDLQATGFSIQRVVDCDQVPVSGASLACAGDDCGEAPFHYLNNSLDDFTGSATGASGLVVVTNSPGGLDTVCGTEGNQPQTPCPALPDRATVGFIVTGDCVDD